ALPLYLGKILDRTLASRSGGLMHEAKSSRQKRWFLEAMVGLVVLVLADLWDCTRRMGRWRCAAFGGKRWGDFRRHLLRWGGRWLYVPPLGRGVTQRCCSSQRGMFYTDNRPSNQMRTAGQAVSGRSKALAT